MALLASSVHSRIVDWSQWNHCTLISKLLLFFSITCTISFARSLGLDAWLVNSFYDSPEVSSGSCTNLTFVLFVWPPTACRMSSISIFGNFLVRTIILPWYICLCALIVVLMIHHISYIRLGYSLSDVFHNVKCHHVMFLIAFVLQFRRRFFSVDHFSSTHNRDSVCSRPC